MAEKAYENDEVSFTVTLPKGYTLENVLCTADGENLNTITEENGSYTFIMPGKNVTITVNVRPIQYTINLDLQRVQVQQRLYTAVLKIYPFYRMTIRKNKDITSRAGLMHRQKEL